MEALSPEGRAVADKIASIRNAQPGEVGREINARAREFGSNVATGANRIMNALGSMVGIGRAPLASEPLPEPAPEPFPAEPVGPVVKPSPMSQAGMRGMQPARTGEREEGPEMISQDVFTQPSRPKKRETIFESPDKIPNEERVFGSHYWIRGADGKPFPITWTQRGWWVKA
jgi:hypothetical protein